jgi:LmbE family N-acetylglucosaminyl deacetylase
MKQSKKILVIAPHADDEVLGCGGYLLHQKEEGAKIKIVIGTIGGDDIRQNFQVRYEEFLSVCTRLEADWAAPLYRDRDAKLDTIPSYNLTTAIDGVVDDFKPDEIFINYRSQHQDHMKMYDCAMASMRLREGYMPKLVALYEYPFVMDGMDIVKGGKMYHDISDNITEKIELFNLYKSQVRESPSPLNGKGIITLASVRGMECGVQYAEKFYIQKMIL